MADRLREPFPASYPIRRSQHDEMERFLSARLRASPERWREFFRPDMSSVEAYERSIEEYRREFLWHIALLDPPSIGVDVPLEPSGRRLRIEEVGEDEVARIHRVWIPVADGLELYGLYLVPRSVAVGKDPGRTAARASRAGGPMIVAQHGGSGCPEAVCGLDERDAYDGFGRRAVERGYIVFAPFILMTVSYGGDPKPRYDRYAFDRMARLVGLSIVGIEVYKIIEGLRVLVSERSEIDDTRVGMAGLSYGGYYALQCAAASTRFACAVVAGILRSKVGDGGRGDFQGPQDRLFYNAANTFETVPTAGLVCPRPLMIQHGSTDPVVPVEGARPVAGEIAEHYATLGIADRFEYHEHDGGHEFRTDAVLAFFDRHL